MSWDVEIAKMFNSRNNKSVLGALLGTVLEVDEDDGITDLKVGLLDSQIILKEFWSNVTRFEKGDTLLFVTSGDNQKFYCVCKISKIGGDDGDVS